MKKTLDPIIEQHHKEMSKLTGMEERQVRSIRSMYFTQNLTTRQVCIDYLKMREALPQSTKFKRKHRADWPQIRSSPRGRYRKLIANLENMSDRTFELIVKKLI